MSKMSKRRWGPKTKQQKKIEKRKVQIKKEVQEEKEKDRYKGGMATSSNQIKKQRRRTVFWLTVLAFGLGCVFHYTYEWLGQGVWSIFFSAVNESIWEHMKLAFVPVGLVLFLPLSEYQKKLTGSQRLCQAGLGTMIATFLVGAVYYLLHVGFGINSLVVDISILGIADFIGICESFYRNFSRNRKVWTVVYALGLFVGVILFSLFSFYPPPFEIFR